MSHGSRSTPSSSGAGGHFGTRRSAAGAAWCGTVTSTRYGRKVLSESSDIGETARAITRYVAARLIERDRALAQSRQLHEQPPQTNWRTASAFVLGLLAGAAALAIVALLAG